MHSRQNWQRPEEGTVLIKQQVEAVGILWLLFSMNLIDGCAGNPMEGG